MADDSGRPAHREGGVRAAQVSRAAMACCTALLSVAVLRVRVSWAYLLRRNIGTSSRCRSTPFHVRESSWMVDRRMSALMGRMPTLLGVVETTVAPDDAQIYVVAGEPVDVRCSAALTGASADDAPVRSALEELGETVRLRS